jgi:PLP dependent protein
MTLDLAGVEERYKSVCEKVRRAAERSGRNRDEITIVAVSKTFPVSYVRILYDLGHRDFGENKVQELCSKAEELTSDCPDLRWHMIGHLQRNKVRFLSGIVHCFHALDRLSLAREIQKRWPEQTRLPCFVQLNISREESKSGIFEHQLDDFLTETAQMDRLEIVGLMGMAAASGVHERVRSEMTVLRKAASSTHLSEKSRNLSMGMSQDYEIAIEEGATHVRIGSGIFGKRSYAEEGSRHGAVN